jgi:acyl-CoA synthetase (AMP-forming)/AMP-acid ligase II
MPMFHIGGMAAWGLYLPSGGRVVILPAYEPGAVLRAIGAEEITSIGAVPTMLAFLLRHPDFDPSVLDTLDLVMYGAAPMPPSLLATFMQMRPDLAFHQAYGMTEICAIATGLTRGDHVRGGEILTSVGRPSLGVELELRDPDTGEPTPPGQVGEIWLRADSVMTGYWNKPEQTAASLVDGWYRSGDAARLDDEGYVFLADRVKDMIVTGGENVYSIEVEQVLAAHPGVEQVAVIGIPDATWGEVVHAVVVGDPDTVTVEGLEATARRNLAGFKVPRSWSVGAEPLPLSAAGKVLKRELRERFGADGA